MNYIAKYQYPTRARGQFYKNLRLKASKIPKIGINAQGKSQLSSIALLASACLTAVQTQATLRLTLGTTQLSRMLQKRSIGSQESEAKVTEMGELAGLTGAVLAPLERKN